MRILPMRMPCACEEMHAHEPIYPSPELSDQVLIPSRVFAHNVGLLLAYADSHLQGYDLEKEVVTV